MIFFGGKRTCFVEAAERIMVYGSFSIIALGS